LALFGVGFDQFGIHVMVFDTVLVNVENSQFFIKLTVSKSLRTMVDIVNIKFVAQRICQKMKLITLTLTFAWALVGCAASTPSTPPDLSSVGADFKNAYILEFPALDAAVWRGFEDPVLEALVAQAKAANLDVRIAQQRVLMARAGSRAVASRGLPTVAITGSVSDQRSGLPEEVKRGSPDTRSVRVGVDMNWELDVFGAASAAGKAAEFDALAADAAVEVSQWMVGAEVARQYLVWQGARLRLQHWQALHHAQKDSERLMRNRQTHGMASQLDVSRAAAAVHSVAAQLPQLQAAVDVAETQIQVLIGKSPSQSRVVMNTQEPPRLPVVQSLGAGQPLSLIQRRPDLRVAQQQLQAEFARHRESQANLWPRFYLSAALGQQDLRLNMLDLSPASFTNIALAFTAPVFNAGRLRAARDRQSAKAKEATLQYERAVLLALQDVENSLVSMSAARERKAELDAAASTQRQGLQHAQSLYREGQIDRLSLLDTQRAVIVAELAAIDGHTLGALSVVQLIQSLGGGWQTEAVQTSADNAQKSPNTAQP
jgi:NodT family efflux transporter outer membrane factor (OMF) lipoprotein